MNLLKNALRAAISAASAVLLATAACASPQPPLPAPDTQPAPPTPAPAATPASVAPTEPTAAGPVVLPATATPPTIDGDLSDPCWTAARLLTDFTQPQSADAPAQKIEARLCADDKAIYVALTCFEKNPANIVANKTADRGDLWMDDCVELFFRLVGDSNEFDQFILNTRAVQATHRVHPDGQPGSPAHPFKTTWTAQVKIGADRYTAEFAIPLDNLGLDAPPAPGRPFEFKIGREDRAGGLPPTAKPGDATLATWPPRSRYAHAENYAAACFFTSNLLRNPDFTAPGKNGQPFAHWSVDLQPGDEKVFTALPAAPAQNAVPATPPTLQIQAPGHYLAMSQSLKLPPGATRFRLHCETKGDAGAYLRARLRLDPNEKDTRPLTVDLPASADWTPHDLAFPASLDGEALIILGVTENNKGPFALRHLELTLEPTAPVQGPAIPVPAQPQAGAPTPFVIEVLRVSDCRSLRGFIGAPIDGTVNSLGWNAEFWEYNRPGAGQGVGYAYHDSDGLHLTLADNRGIDALQIHGGIAADLIADATRYDDPASGTLVQQFPGHTQHTLALLHAPGDATKPLATAKLSFFYVRDGYLADVNLFRYGPHATRRLPDLGTRADCFLLAGGAMLPTLQPWMAQRFPTTKNAVFHAADPAKPVNAEVPPIRLAPGATAHLVTYALPAETALTAIGLTATLQDTAPGTLLQLQLQDPLAPRTALTTVLVALPGNGKLDLVLDIPDQILPASTTLWLTLTAPAGPLTLAGPALQLYSAPRETAAPEALAFRLTKLQGFFAAMSEARPWNSLYSRVKDVDAWIDDNKQFAVQLHEIKDAIEYCHALDPQNDTATQYYNWFYRHNKKPPLKTPVLPTPETHPETKGAPDWAVAARAAWLTTREVPLWWIDHRSVPTGELGGEVGDDTDQFGNYAPFPLFQQDGPTAKIIACADRLADTAEKLNLRAGLNRVTMDPLHAYEEGLNHEAQMLWWHYGDPVFFERCLAAAKSTESLTTVNAAGHRHFKNQDCGAQDLDFDRPLGVDGFAHNQMLHPLFEVLWYNRNPRALKLAREWGDAWLAHQQPDAYAGMVDVKTDAVVPDSVSKEPFASGFGGQQAAFLFLFHVTGDAKYLQPLKDWLQAGHGPGGWANLLPELYQAGFLDDLPPAILTNLCEQSPALQWVATGDKTAFVNALKNDVAEVQTFRHLYTTAEVFTDRVFLYAIINPSIAYTGGYATRNKFCQSQGLSYEGFGDDYAALVRTVRKDKVVVLLYSFADQPVTGVVRPWLLEHGQYRVDLGVDANGDDVADPVDLRRAEAPRSEELAKGWPLKITLPPRQVVVLTLTQTEKLDRIEDRADLALSAREIQVDADGTIGGVAHNIGGAPANHVIVGLFNAKGEELERAAVGELAAPVDGTPSRAAFRLKPADGIPADHAGWRILIFTGPRDGVAFRQPEITEENNSVSLP